MISAPPPKNEDERLRWLAELNILDTVEEQAYDDLTLLASQICQTPIALISLVDHSRQWFKSHFGLDARETPREYAFCAHAILGEDLFIVEDADRDERFSDNPLVSGSPHVKFYAGVPLILRENICIGTLCIIDNNARSISEDQAKALKALARKVVSEMELRLKIKELQRLDHAKDEFISMVSHELRTPLTSIKGALGLLEHTESATTGAKETKSLVQVAYRNADRLIHIVNDILDIAKLQAGKLVLNLEVLDITELVKRAVELNAPYFKHCGCALALQQSTESRPLLILGDEQRLTQVITNLVSNAAKFTHEDDTIEVSLTVSDSNVHFSVTDHGPGIPQTQQHLVFQKFSQAQQGNNKLPGTGLGLNICKNIIALHNGQIGFSSIPNEETIFYFSLPLVTDNE